MSPGGRGLFSGHFIAPGGCRQSPLAVRDPMLDGIERRLGAIGHASRGDVHAQCLREPRFARAGFGRVTVERLPHDIQNFYYVCARSGRERILRGAHIGNVSRVTGVTGSSHLEFDRWRRRRAVPGWRSDQGGRLGRPQEDTSLRGRRAGTPGCTGCGFREARCASQRPCPDEGRAP